MKDMKENEGKKSPFWPFFGTKHKQPSICSSVLATFYYAEGSFRILKDFWPFLPKLSEIDQSRGDSTSGFVEQTPSVKPHHSDHSSILPNIARRGNRTTRPIVNTLVGKIYPLEFWLSATHSRSFQVFCAQRHK
jgi:hypothetical protein